MPSLLQSRALFLLAVVTQFLLGFLNWVLMAPDALQILHLLMADLVFISFWLSGLKQGLPIEVMPVEVRREKT